MSKRPIAIVLVVCLYLAVGTAGLVAHFHDSLTNPRSGVWIELIEVLAIVAGTFMLLGRSWARWLALAWMVFHVILSIFHSVHELVIHALLCIMIAWVLFRPATARYFCES